MPQVWEFVFLMLILKLPILYLCWVVWWAVKSKPRPPEYAVMPARLELEPRSPWTRSTRASSRPRGPHGAPTRGYRQPARARAPL